MPSKHSLSVSLTAHLHHLVEAQVASGRFGSASEVVRAGLRLLERELNIPAQTGVAGSSTTAADGAGGSMLPPRTL